MFLVSLAVAALILGLPFFALAAILLLVIATVSSPCDLLIQPKQALKWSAVFMTLTILGCMCLRFN